MSYQLQSVGTIAKALKFWSFAAVVYRFVYARLTVQYQ